MLVCAVSNLIANSLSDVRRFIVLLNFAGLTAELL